MKQPFNYQINAIEYFASKCRNQHGLILNHELASGKTYTSVLFLKNYPKKKKIIILPDGLQNTWLNEAKQVGITENEITFITFEKLLLFKKNLKSFTALLNDSVVIIDECHNLYKIIHYIQESDRSNNLDNPFRHNKYNTPLLVKFMDLFKSCYKVLLVSGALIMNEISDIRWLINIAAGNSIITNNEVLFNRKFLKVSKVDAFLIEWIMPVIRLIPLLNQFEFLKKDKNSEKNTKNYFDIIFQIASAYLQYNYAFNAKMLKVEANHIPKLLYNMLIKDRTLIRTLLAVNIMLYGFNIITEFLKVYYYDNYHFKSINPDAFKSAKIYKYISYYRQEDDKHFKDLYPSVKHIVKKVVYTEQQLRLWIKLLNIKYTHLSPEEYVSLDLSPNIKEAELYSVLEIDVNIYQTQGRVIGNLYDEPNKFDRIVKMYLKNPESTVIYSHFYKNGIDKLAKYMKNKKIKYALYTPYLTNKRRDTILQEFKDKQIMILLLHPAYMEGLNIQGARLFHILEPVALNYKRKQLYARVSRLNSHTHLPKKEQNVKIITWGCTILYDPDKINILVDQSEIWYKSNKLYRNYFEHLSKFSSFFSPDDQLIAISNRNDKFIKSFDLIFKNQNVNKSKIPLSCNIYKPPIKTKTKSKSKTKNKLPNCYEI